MTLVSPLAALLLLAIPCASFGLPVQTVPHAKLKPVMDAAADDPAWKDAALISTLTLSRGDDAKGLEPTPTTIQFLWDADALYLRFTCRDKEIETPFQGRDQPHYKGDAVEFFLDVVGDARRYIEIQLSPANQIFDQLISLDAPPESKDGRLTDAFFMKHLKMDPTWNFEGLRSATRRIPGGWIAEMALPPAPLGLPHWKPMMVRANLLRYDWLVPASGESRLVAMNWAPVFYGCPHISPEAMGMLELLPEE